MKLGYRNIPGNSVKETGDRMNGGAVKDDKSPEKDAMLMIANQSQIPS